MLLRRSTSTWSESLIWINPRRGYSRSMITYAVTDKTTAKATECKYIQTTPNRHVVAREQRTGESQRAEHPEDHQWRMNSSGLCSRRGDVEHRVQRGQEQHRRLGRSRFPRGGDSERPYFALQLRRPRLLRFHRLHIRHLPIDLDPRVQVTTEEIAPWVAARPLGAERPAAMPCPMSLASSTTRCRRASKRVSAPENENARIKPNNPKIAPSIAPRPFDAVSPSSVSWRTPDAPPDLEQYEDASGQRDCEDGSGQDDVH